MSGQTPEYDLEPPLEWKRIDWAPSDWYGNSQPNQDESGDEWWYGHANYVAVDGLGDGYITAGYATWPLIFDEDSQSWNYDYSSGTCNPYSPGATGIYDDFETDLVRKGPLRQTIARYAEDGSMLWCKRYNFGSFFNITQLSDGSIIAVGHTNDITPNSAVEDLATYSPEYYSPDYVTTEMHYNPSAGGSNASIDPAQCVGKRRLSVVKVDSNGKIIFNYHYGHVENDGTPAVEKAIANTSGNLNDVFVDGDRLRVVGVADYVKNGSWDEGLGNSNLGKGLPIVLSLDHDGNLIQSSLLVYDYLTNGSQYISNLGSLPDEANLIAGSNIGLDLWSIAVEADGLYCAGNRFELPSIDAPWAKSRVALNKLTIGANDEL